MAIFLPAYLEDFPGNGAIHNRMIRGADFKIPQNRSEENANKNILRLDLLVRITKMKVWREQ